MPIHWTGFKGPAFRRPALPPPSSSHVLDIDDAYPGTPSDALCRDLLHVELEFMYTYMYVPVIFCLNPDAMIATHHALCSLLPKYRSGKRPCHASWAACSKRRQSNEEGFHQKKSIGIRISS
eukprot:1155545-Pelagomonas_calceolata.AAC.12